jgi:L-type amino acid transporter 9
VILFLIAMYLIVAPLVDSPKIEIFYVLAFMAAGLIFYFPFVFKEWRIPGVANVYRKVEDMFNLSLSEKTLE